MGKGGLGGGPGLAIGEVEAGAAGRWASLGMPVLRTLEHVEYHCDSLFAHSKVQEHNITGTYCHIAFHVFERHSDASL
jgi:hypothetical protein